MSAGVPALGLLDAQLFPGDEKHDFLRGQNWLAIHAGLPVGFASALWWPPDRCVYLSRVGAIPEARGHGLQRRFIRARLRWAREQGAKGAYTYTVPFNVMSSNNLIREGFTLWRPSKAVRDDWTGEPGALFWWRGLP